MEIQAIAKVTVNDVAQEISELSETHIENLFLLVVRKLDNPDFPKRMANILIHESKIRYGI